MIIVQSIWKMLYRSGASLKKPHLNFLFFDTSFSRSWPRNGLFNKEIQQKYKMRKKLINLNFSFRTLAAVPKGSFVVNILELREMLEMTEKCIEEWRARATITRVQKKCKLFYWPKATKAWQPLRKCDSVPCVEWNYIHVRQISCLNVKSIIGCSRPFI